MKKYAFPILILFLIFVTFYFIFINTTSQAPPNLIQVKNKILGVLHNMDSDLSQSAQKIAKTGLNSQETSKILQEFCTNHPYTTDCATLSPKGILSLIEPAQYKGVEGTDISDQPHIKQFMQNPQPSISPSFEAVEGNLAVVFQYPVFSKKQLAGVVSSLFSPHKLIGEITKPIIENSSTDIWVMQKNGIIIYDPDKAEIGRNLFTDELYLPFEELQKIGREIVKVDNGIGKYSFYKKGFSKTISKRIYWETLKFRNCEWKIIMTLPIEKGVSAKRTTKDLGIKTL